MKFGLTSALALSLAFASVSAPAAFAQEPAQQFRSVEAQTFSTDELQRYGLSVQDADQVAAYQAAGYTVQTITPEEAAQMNAGQFSNSQWLIIGLVVLIVVVAAT
jgi:flagellar basal body-associated protein FliL